MQTIPFNSWWLSTALPPAVPLPGAQVWHGSFFPCWMAEWAPWHAGRQGQPPGMFVGHFGYAFVSRLSCCLVLSYLSQEGFRSDTGAAAELKTPLPGKGTSVLYHRCNVCRAPCIAQGTPSCCSAVGNELKTASACFSSVSQALSHAVPAYKLQIHSPGNKATALFPVQVPWHFQQ